MCLLLKLFFVLFCLFICLCLFVCLFGLGFFGGGGQNTLLCNDVVMK